MEPVFVHGLKLRPPQLLPTWMERPHLERRLRPGIRALSIVAGPGYGKTVLAARLHAMWAGPKLWYSLDAGDADLAQFAAHLDSGIRTLGVNLPPFDDANAAAVGPPSEVAARFAEGLAEIKKPPLLVFDDVHALEGSRALVALNELVERAARFGACFVLCGRSMPLMLHPIAASSQLASVGASDLAFDDAEAQTYLHRSLNAEAGSAKDALASLVGRAEGWPAGLALIASGIPAPGRRELERAQQGAVDHKGPQAEPRASDEENRRYLFDYLASEVLERLTPQERQFLLDTSILDQLETDLCDTIRDAGGSGEILQSFAERGLFVTRLSDDAYRYHQLFREFLRHNLAQSQPLEYRSRLHHRAAEYLSARGDPALAIGHYLDSGEVEAGAAELERAAFAMLRAGLISTVSHLLRRLSSERIGASPALLVAFGRIQRERGDWGAALPSLERAISAARTSKQYDVLAEAVRTCAPILASRGEFEQLRLMLDEALSSGLDLPETSVTSLRMTLAAVYLEMDRLDESLAIYREITPSVVARGDLAAHGLVLHNTAVAHLRRGDVYAGLSLYERALKLKEAAGHRISLLTTLGDLIYTKTLLGDVEEAERLVETMLAQAQDVGATGIVAHAHEQRGVLKLSRGDVEGATQAYRSSLEASDPSDMILLPEIEHGLAKCAIMSGNLAQADELCARAIEMFRTAGRHQQLAPVLATRADLTLDRGDARTAVKLAREAIDEAGHGTNALLQTSTCLEAASTLARAASQLGGAEAMQADQRATEAATTAIALLHQRDYRFLLRTKSVAFGQLGPHLRRWKVGSGLLPEIKAESPATALRIETLGTFRAFVGGQEVSPETWKRRRALDIFAYLVSQRGRGVPRARLIDLYWPESEADAAHDSLRVTITAVRKAVGDVIKYEANSYRFTAPKETVIDFDLFDANIEHAHQAEAVGDVEQTRRCYQDAADLYRGDFLEGMQEGGWQWRERERLRADCIEALRWLALERESVGDIAGQRRAVERLLEVAPFDLEAVKMRLDGLSREMRIAEARRDYEGWRARYKAAVGAEAPDIWHSPDGPGQVARVPAG